MIEEESPLDPLPICLGCWRQRFGFDEDPPPPPLNWYMERCAVCAGDTNHGLYLLRGVGRR